MKSCCSAFGELLKKLISEAGQTQSEFYEALGIKKPYFYDILSGKTNPLPPPQQFRAVKILGLDKQEKENERRQFFDLAAQARHELPADIVQYLVDNPNAQKEIRNHISSIDNQ